MQNRERALDSVYSSWLISLFYGALFGFTVLYVFHVIIGACLSYAINKNKVDIFPYGVKQSIE